MNTYKLAADIAAFIETYEFYDFRDMYENMDDAISDNMDMLETCPECIYNYFAEHYNEPDFMPAAGSIMNRIKELMNKEEKPVNNISIITASADYSGGGIYIYHGVAGFNGKVAYFLTDDTNNATMILDESPIDFDESLTYEWQHEHTIGEISDEEHLNFMEQMINFIISSQPAGNYADNELSHRLSLIKALQEKADKSE